MDKIIAEFEESKNMRRYFHDKESVSNEIDKLERMKSNVKLIEITHESIPQMVCLLSLVSFYWFSYHSTGVKYPYFFGIAQILLKDNVNNNILFIAGFIISFTSSAWVFVKHTHLTKHRSLDFKRKFILFLHYFFSLFARIGSIACSLNLPVIMNSDYMQTFQSFFDFNELNSIILRNTRFETIFLRYFGAYWSDYIGRHFTDISEQILINMIVICVILLIYVIGFILYAEYNVTMFRESSVIYKVFIVISNMCRATID